MPNKTLTTALEKERLAVQKSEVEAARTSASTKALARYARSGSVPVKEAVAKNPYTSPDTLRRLTEDVYVHTAVLLAVAGNMNTPPAVLSKLVSSSTLPVVEVVARNPNASAVALHVIASRNDISYDVLHSVAHNRSTSAITLAKKLPYSFAVNGVQSGVHSSYKLAKLHAMLCDELHNMSPAERVASPDRRVLASVALNMLANRAWITPHIYAIAQMTDAMYKLL